jgi:hypothetical protein
MGLVLIDNLAKLNLKVKMVPLTWPNMVARAPRSSPRRTCWPCSPRRSPRIRRGRVQVPQELLGQVLRLVVLQQRRRVGLIERARTLTQVGGARAALRRDPEAHRRRHARRSSACCRTAAGHAGSREGLRVQPGPPHRRGGSLPAGDLARSEAIRR